MIPAIEVMTWGRRIGAAALDDAGVVAFEYDRDFVRSGIEVSPLTMPLRAGVFRFPELPRETFQGLPGLLADSLPDRFGGALVDAWLARSGRTPSSVNVLERLCIVGTRGMGSLEFHPPAQRAPSEAVALDIEALTQLAAAILAERDEVRVRVPDQPDDETMRQLILVGTSAGGARAKALIAWNPSTNEIRAGHGSAPEGFAHWLLKFDGVAENRDRELADPQGFGALEYAYHRMAVEAGIEMAPCRLLEEGPRRHFMTRRFDRTASGERLHMLTLGAMAHFDFNAAGAHAWEDAFGVARRLRLGQPALDELFRRMVFNVVTRNHDDHVKNIAFLMDKRGRWRLAPAYDLTYSYNPVGAWTSRHQMSIAGKREGISRDDLLASARAADLALRRADAIIDRVLEVARTFPAHAAALDVEPRLRATVERNLRLDL